MFIIILTNRPVPDRYAGWCERTGSEIIATFLLDYYYEHLCPNWHEEGFASRVGADP
jgi:hypothetical protein